MNLTGLHLLLTYQCTYECDHCFAWGSPRQSGTMTLDAVQRILQQARELETIEWIYFEGGEPFLYYAPLVRSVRRAFDMGFKVGIVTNAYWATTVEDAVEWLRPLAGKISDLSVSSDLYHASERLSLQARNAEDAARQLKIPLGIVSIATPGTAAAEDVIGKLPPGESSVRFRGRAVEKLVDRAALGDCGTFTSCPYENLREPDRLHVDPFGFLHLCQGITIGNLFERPLIDICSRYDPLVHPIAGALLAGGPMELARRYGLAHRSRYADACHMCTELRRGLRERFPEILAPAQMYGVV